MCDRAASVVEVASVARIGEVKYERYCRENENRLFLCVGKKKKKNPQRVQLGWFVSLVHDGGLKRH